MSVPGVYATSKFTHIQTGRPKAANRREEDENSGVDAIPGFCCRSWTSIREAPAGVGFVYIYIYIVCISHQWIKAMKSWCSVHRVPKGSMYFPFFVAVFGKKQGLLL